ncbi:HigA family addiction module antitoxin [Lactiplantibacillus pentosus]|uniref:HigA family addiction module antitoxin n=1 Tax=Lactiplantibacillus pentosus TaxID=1589 RepID=UPI0021A96898|nr:HigA family addiction module antitoxin [Lactiplantibacillus pentosus]MCT3307558.1 addiction module antidote protein, HigA family [Lactiplantibacillus pentosus]
MGKEIEYKDIIAFHPGGYIEELIAYLNITQTEFAQHVKLPTETISQIISGEASISLPIATKLADYTGISSQTWLNLQAKYDEKISEIENASD